MQPLQNSSTDNRATTVSQWFLLENNVTLKFSLDTVKTSYFRLMFSLDIMILLTSLQPGVWVCTVSTPSPAPTPKWEINAEPGSSP